MREARGLTREQLAHQSETSVPTLQRAEMSDDLTWRRATHIRVLTAFERVAPITDEEFASYVDAAGLGDFARSSMVLANSPAMRRAIGLTDVLSSMPVNDAMAFRWLGELIDELGAERVLEGLQGLAAVSTVRLSNPSIHAHAASQAAAPAATPPARSRGASGPRMLVKPPRVVDGIEVQEFVPVPKPKPASPRSVDTKRIPKRG